MRSAIANPHAEADEAERQRALERYEVLDTVFEQAFDDVVRLASTVCGAPVATLSLVDRDRQWFKASVGMAVSQTPRSESICSIAIRMPTQLLEIEDVSASALVGGIRPRDAGGELLRFYAGMPVLSPDGHALGTVCVLDHAPRQLTDAQREALRALARQAGHLLELRRFATQRDRDAHTLARARDDLQRRHDHLKHNARTDPLTGLLNRAGLEQLRGHAETMAKLDAAGYVLGMLDIDRFKRVNDRHGHRAGDLALRMVADAVRSAIRDTDLAVRFGGEEVLLVFPSTPLAGAYEVAERIRRAVAQSRELPFPISVSIGIAAGDPERDTPDAVFERADQALYRAKAGGRDRVVADDTERI